MSPEAPEFDIATVPERSSVLPLPTTEIEARDLKSIVTIWNEKRAIRMMPSRASILPRPLGSLLRYVSLVSVPAEDRNYEFRIIGNVHIQAYGRNQQGQRMNDVIAAAPGFGNRLKRSLDIVVDSRAPKALRGIIGQDVGDARFVWFETVFLPLGDSDSSVDHIMIATVYKPRNGMWRELGPN